MNDFPGGPDPSSREAQHYQNAMFSNGFLDHPAISQGMVHFSGKVRFIFPGNTIHFPGKYDSFQEIYESFPETYESFSRDI